VLGLRQHIGSNDTGVCRAVRDDANLAWAGREVDLGVLAEHHLGKGDIDIARPDNLLHRANGLCPERHGGNSLRPAGIVDLGHSRDIESNKSQGLDRRRRAGTDLFYPGNPRGNRTHQRG
jgi:hypothetical protein